MLNFTTATICSVTHQPVKQHVIQHYEKLLTLLCVLLDVCSPLEALLGDQPINQQKAQPINQQKSQPINQQKSQPINQQQQVEAHKSLCLTVSFVF